MEQIAQNLAKLAAEFGAQVLAKPDQDTIHSSAVDYGERVVDMLAPTIDGTAAGIIAEAIACLVVTSIAIRLPDNTDPKVREIVERASSELEASLVELEIGASALLAEQSDRGLS